MTTRSIVYHGGNVEQKTHRLSRKHNTVGAVKNGVGDVSSLGASGTRVEDHTVIRVRDDVTERAFDQRVSQYVRLGYVHNE
jgi:hypothetical protein